MRWEGQSVRMEYQNIPQKTVLRGKRPLQKPRKCFKDEININLKSQKLVILS